MSTRTLACHCGAKEREGCRGCELGRREGRIAPQLRARRPHLVREARRPVGEPLHAGVRAARRAPGHYGHGGDERPQQRSHRAGARSNHTSGRGAEAKSTSPAPEGVARSLMFSGFAYQGGSAPTRFGIRRRRVQWPPLTAASPSGSLRHSQAAHRPRAPAHSSPLSTPSPHSRSRAAQPGSSRQQERTSTASHGASLAGLPRATTVVPCRVPHSIT